MAARVLVVDNEPAVLGAVRKCLRKTGLIVDSVESGEDALLLIGKSKYDLVITDLMMRGIDGIELIRRIREIGWPGQVIMLTGYPTIETALVAKHMGAADYLTKPFTRDELVGAVLRVLHGGSQGDMENLERQGPGDGTYLIRGRSWVVIEPGGSARLGMTRGFAASLGKILEIKLPSQNDRLEQGRECATIHTSDQIEHTLYSPLSGKVLELNLGVRDDPRLLSRDPEGAGWLIRIVPEFPDREQPNLSPR